MPACKYASHRLGVFLDLSSTDIWRQGLSLEPRAYWFSWLDFYFKESVSLSECRTSPHLLSLCVGPGNLNPGPQDCMDRNQKPVDSILLLVCLCISTMLALQSISNLGIILSALFFLLWITLATLAFCFVSIYNFFNFSEEKSVEF